MEKKVEKIAMIPARIGSTRLPMKNLALIDGEPMISYAIRAAKNSGVFDRVVVNADAPLFATIAARYGVEFYLRPARLGSSATKSDDVVHDFMKNSPADIVAWVNPTSPLQSAAVVSDVVAYFQRERLDTLITVKNEQVHANFAGLPLNYSTDELFAQTQDLTPVELFVYSVMMWRTEPFMDDYARHGHAFFVGKVGFYPVDRLSSIIIKREEDLRFAEFVLKNMQQETSAQLRYDSLAEEVEVRRG